MMQADGESFTRHLEILKQKLVQAEDFEEIQIYFLDHLGENNRFMQLGEVKRDNRLQRVLAVIAQQALQTPIVAVQHLTLIYLRRYRFTHGSGVLNGYMGSVIYFGDIDVGLLTLTPFPPSTEESKMARFSIRTVDYNPKPSEN